MNKQAYPPHIVPDLRIWKQKKNKHKHLDSDKHNYLCPIKVLIMCWD